MTPGCHRSSQGSAIEVPRPLRIVAPEIGVMARGSLEPLFWKGALWTIAETSWREPPAGPAGVGHLLADANGPAYSRPPAEGEGNQFSVAGENG